MSGRQSRTRRVRGHAESERSSSPSPPGARCHNGRPFSFFMTAGQISDYIGAAALLDDCPRHNACLPIAVMTSTGSETPWRRRVSNPSSQAENQAKSPSNSETPLQASQPYRVLVRWLKRLAPDCHPLRSMPNCLLLRAPPPSSFGYDQRDGVVAALPDGIKMCQQSGGSSYERRGRQP